MDEFNSTLDDGDECPNCQSNYGEYLGSYNVRCAECDHKYNLRELNNLPLSTCAVCYRRLSWGCGHSTEQEVEALKHQNSTDHLLGDCDCFVSRDGYMAFVDRSERREQVATLIRNVIELLDETKTRDVAVALKQILPTGRGWA